MRTCKHCSIQYRPGTYYSHRRSEQHLETLKPRVARYSTGFATCELCRMRYPAGDYHTHAEDEEHLVKTQEGRHRADQKRASTFTNSRRLTIAQALEGGLSYGQAGKLTGITRQRVQQIAKTMGISHPRSRPKIGEIRRCFVCSGTYEPDKWMDHESDPSHQKAVKGLTTWLQRFRPRP